MGGSFIRRQERFSDSWSSLIFTLMGIAVFSTFFATPTLASEAVTKHPKPPPNAVMAWPEEPNLQAVRLMKVDMNGNAGPLFWVTKAAWRWGKETPFLRTWIQLPPEYSSVALSETADGKRKTGFRFVEQPDDSPFPKGNQVFAVDAMSAGVVVPLSVRTKAQPGVSMDIGLMIMPYTEHSSYFVQHSCRELGIQASTRSVGEGRFLFAAASCSSEGLGRVRVRVFHSDDAQWYGLPQSGVEREQDGSIVFVLEKPRSPDFPPPVVGLSVGPKSGKAPSMLAVTMEIPPIKRYGMVVGLGATLISYLEPALDVHLSEVGITGKVTGYYLIKPGVFDGGVNAFVTLLPVYHTPSSIPAARSFGSNVRFGWQLPMAPAGLTFNLSAGWYFWGMLVPDAAYGVSFLSGPQAFILMRGTFRDGRTYSGYFKFAPISESISFNGATNREFALGGAFPISKPRTRHPLSLTLDLADASFTSDDLLSSMRMSTVTLGIQMGF